MWGKWSYQFFIFLFFIGSLNIVVYARTVSSLESYPDQIELNQLLKTPICMDYLRVTHNGVDENSFNTDQLQVYKNGYLVDEYYKPGVYSADQFHVLMSATKPVTATILDAAIHAGLRYKGQLVTYDTKLSEFYPAAYRYKLINEKNVLRKKKNLKEIALKPNDYALYGQITIRHLTRMQAGFKWDESYSNPLGDFMSALYLDGIRDIVGASLSVPMEIEPGTKFNYSGANVNIAQGILSLLGKENYNEPDANKVAHILLFSRLGIKDAFFETDKKGSPVGSTYLHMKPKGMAILGQLYLNKGIWFNNKNSKDEQILTNEFIQSLSSVNSAVDHAVIDDSYLKYIKEEGVPSNAITWVNKDVIDYENNVRYSHEFPNSPGDMFVLAGHNGQMIMVFPSQEMVVAITGNNKGYWNKINKLAYYSSKCFSNLKYARDIVPNTFEAPSPSEEYFFKKAKDAVIDLEEKLPPALRLLFSPIAAGVAAKELCTCMTVNLRTTNLKKGIEYCPGDLPMTLQKAYKIKTDFNNGFFRVKSVTHYFVRRATMNKYGCTLNPVDN